MKIRSLVFSFFVLLSACATQKDMKYVQGEVSELRQESTRLRQESSKLRQESNIIKEQSAGSYSEITQYREEIALLRGAINELRHDFSVSMNRLDLEDSLLVRQKNDLESRITRIENFLAIENTRGSNVVLPAMPVSSAPDVSLSPASPALPQSTSVFPAVSPEKSREVALVKPSPQQVASAQTNSPRSGATAESAPEASSASDALLNQGVLRMKKQDYEGARQNILAFMKLNPNSSKLAYAQFSVAETWYGEKWYEKAILAYQVVIEKYAKSDKRVAALYKQGLAFEKIGDPVSAKKRFRDVVNLYPATPEAELARKKLDIR